MTRRASNRVQRRPRTSCAGTSPAPQRGKREGIGPSRDHVRGRLAGRDPLREHAVDLVVVVGAEVLTERQHDVHAEALRSVDTAAPPIEVPVGTGGAMWGGPGTRRRSPGGGRHSPRRHDDVAVAHGKGGGGPGGDARLVEEPGGVVSVACSDVLAPRQVVEGHREPVDSGRRPMRRRLPPTGRHIRVRGVPARSRGHGGVDCGRVLLHSSVLDRDRSGRRGARFCQLARGRPRRRMVGPRSATRCARRHEVMLALMPAITCP